MCILFVYIVCACMNVYPCMFDVATCVYVPQYFNDGNTTGWVIVESKFAPDSSSRSAADALHCMKKKSTYLLLTGKQGFLLISYDSSDFCIKIVNCV